MEQKSKKSGKIRVVSFADNFIKLVFFNMTFERFVNGKIVKLIKVIARYNRALCLIRELMNILPRKFANFIRNLVEIFL